MSTATTPPHPLQHLSNCPRCGWHVSAPILSSGKSNAESKNMWFEKVSIPFSCSCTKKNDTYLHQCLNNFSPTHSTCRYFEWRSEIPNGRGGRQTSDCPGRLCEVGRRQKINLNCTLALCRRCCVDAHHTLKIPRCGDSGHRHQTRQPVSEQYVPADPHTAPVSRPI